MMKSYGDVDGIPFTGVPIQLLPFICSYGHSGSFAVITPRYDAHPISLIIALGISRGVGPI